MKVIEERRQSFSRFSFRTGGSSRDGCLWKQWAWESTWRDYEQECMSGDVGSLCMNKDALLFVVAHPRFLVCVCVCVRVCLCSCGVVMCHFFLILIKLQRPASIPNFDFQFQLINLQLGFSMFNVQRSMSISNSYVQFLCLTSIPIFDLQLQIPCSFSNFMFSNFQF